MTQQLKQGSEAWATARIGLITGSRVGAILGHSPFATRDDVMREMVREHFGAEREFCGNVATEYGNLHETLALSDYCFERGVELSQVGFITNQEHPFFGVSPDGLVGEDGGVEIKCPYYQSPKPILDTPHYYDQICLSLIVTGRQWWDYCAWTPSEQHIERVEYDEAEIWLAQHAEALDAFIADYLHIINDQEKAAPYLDDLEIDMEANDDWRIHVEQLDAIQAQLKALQAKEKQAKDKLVALAQSEGKKCRGFGRLVFPIHRKGSIDFNAVPELDGVDLEPYRKEGQTSWSVR